MIFNSFNIQHGDKDDSVVLKYELVQYSTLKNEPQVHFSTGSFFNVTPAVVNSYVSKTCDKAVKGRRMLLCRVELCVTEMSASRQILMIYIKTVASVAPC